MSVPTEHDIDVKNLATSIYIQLVKDAVVFSTTDQGSTASITASPEGLATISFKLAEAFLDTSAGIKARAKPKSVAFDVNQMDFGS